MFQLSVPCGREQALSLCDHVLPLHDDMATTASTPRRNHFGPRSHTLPRPERTRSSPNCHLNVRYEYLSRQATIDFLLGR